MNDLELSRLFAKIASALFIVTGIKVLFPTVFGLSFSLFWGLSLIFILAGAFMWGFSMLDEEKLLKNMYTPLVAALIGFGLLGLNLQVISSVASFIFVYKYKKLT